MHKCRARPEERVLGWLGIVRIVRVIYVRIVLSLFHNMLQVPVTLCDTLSQCVIWPFKSTRKLAYYRTSAAEIRNNFYSL